MSSPALHAGAANAANAAATGSPANPFNIPTPQQQQQQGGVGAAHAASPSLFGGGGGGTGTTGNTPGGASPAFMVHHQQQQQQQQQQHPILQHQPSLHSIAAANAAAARTPGGGLLPGGGGGGGSLAGSGISATVTAADAPNEARKLIRAMLEEGGQGRLSIERINKEIALLLQEVNSAFTAPPHSQPTVARLMDLFATLDELQGHLARTGLGAVPVVHPEENVDKFRNSQDVIMTTTIDVQNSFKTRQRIRDGAGVAKSNFLK